MKFKLVSDYKPQGDQPEAIDSLVRSLEEGNQDQTLLGVTGSERPSPWPTPLSGSSGQPLLFPTTKRLPPNCIPNSRPSFRRMPSNTSSVITTTTNRKPTIFNRHFHREDSSINEEIERLRLAATGSLISRNDVIVIASVSCIYGLGSPDDFRLYQWKSKKALIWDETLFWRN